MGMLMWIWWMLLNWILLVLLMHLEIRLRIQLGTRMRLGILEGVQLLGQTQTQIHGAVMLGTGFIESTVTN